MPGYGYNADGQITGITDTSGGGITHGRPRGPRGNDSGQADGVAPTICSCSSLGS